MDLNLSAEDRAFRDRTRAWLATNVPRTELKTLEERRAWHRTMYEAGYVGMAWPKEYGGQGASPMKVAIVFLGCIFPILINSLYGMRAVDRDYVDLARSFRLGRRSLFFKILLPASLPFVLAGIRLAIGRGLTGVAIAEWFGATEGLGYLIFFAGQTLNIPTLFVGVAVFAALGIIAFEVVRRVEIYATPWAKTSAGG